MVRAILALAMVAGVWVWPSGGASGPPPMKSGLDGNAPAAAGPATRPARLAAERFEAKLAGIAFTPPEGGEMTRRRGIVEDVVRFANERQGWTLQVTRMTLRSPQKLVIPDDPVTPNLDESQGGLLWQVKSRLLAEFSAAQVLREDLIRAGKDGTLTIGMLVCRYHDGRQVTLRQQALVQANEQLYYVFDYQTTSSDRDPAEDPQIRADAELFARMLDTVELLDLTKQTEDANERLYRTRALLVNITRQKMEQCLAGDQYLLVYMDNKPIGVQVNYEEPVSRDGRDGVLILQRTLVEPQPGKPLLTRSDLFVSFDRKYESWTTTTAVPGAEAGIVVMRELGFMRMTTRRVLDRTSGAVDPRDPKQPPMKLVELRELTVDRETGGARRKIERELPPYHLPAAMGHLLPRLVPLAERKTYLFASWVAGEAEVMRRYVDVGEEREVNIAGERRRAVVVEDRIGLEGSVVEHYLTPQGRYLGSYTPQTKMATVVVEAQDIRRVFPQADLERPRPQ